MSKFGFIGTGNMGGALARAVAKSVGCENVIVSDKNTESAQLLADELNCRSANTEEVITNAKFLFLGVKPQVLPDVIKEISSALAKRSDRFVLVTMAAGVALTKFDEMFGTQYPIIRIMPNTPVQKGKGMIQYCANSAVQTDELTEFCDSLKFAGRVDNLQENLIDAV